MSADKIDESVVRAIKTSFESMFRKAVLFDEVIRAINDCNPKNSIVPSPYGDESGQWVVVGDSVRHYPTLYQAVIAVIKKDS